MSKTAEGVRYVVYDPPLDVRLRYRSRQLRVVDVPPLRGGLAREARARRGQADPMTFDLIPILVGLAAGAIIWFLFVRPWQRREFERELRERRGEK
jgi:hypothetical protein